ncbi:MAG: FHA domain-containing protein [Pirellulales bacterium]
MSNEMFGELVPELGGDNIPLRKPRLLIGRRESCDITLRFTNVSAHHCELELQGGYWYVNDLNSRNGVKVNDARVGKDKKRIDPGDTLSVSKHKFELNYSPADLGAVGPPPQDEAVADIFSRPLLERAGLKKRGHDEDKAEVELPKGTRDLRKRYDVLNNDAGQVKLPHDKV